MTTPLISVYMPTCNRRGLLQRAVNSVLAQTFDNFELLIVDDCSSDDTRLYLQKLMATDARVRCFFQDSAQGACVARNLAINAAKGKFITGLDDDDEFLPTRLAQLLEAYQPEYAFVCQGFVWQYGKVGKAIDTHGMVIDLSHLLSYNHATNQIFTETAKLRAIDGFDVRFPAFQDYDTWTRLVLAYGPGLRVPGASYVIHHGHDGPRITTKNRKRQGQLMYEQVHGHLMSPINRRQQAFFRCVIERKPLPLSLFWALLWGQFRIQFVRYFISSHLGPLARLRKRWLRRGRG